jgi:Domain of unknown function (DUF4383)
MTHTGAHAAAATDRDASRSRSTFRSLTPAQGYCLTAGLVLLLAGILGFLADSSFDTSSTVDVDRVGNANGQLQGDGFLGFEVNGWHNVVHLLSGLVLLAAFARRRPAKTVALLFGVVYGIVAIIGLIDGNDVLGLIPINAADSVLHLALAALGIVAGAISRGDDDRVPTRMETRTTPAT